MSSFGRKLVFGVRLLAACVVLAWIWVLVAHARSLDNYRTSQLQPISIGSDISYTDDRHMYFKGFDHPGGAYRWTAKPDTALIFKLDKPSRTAFEVCAHGTLLDGVIVIGRVGGRAVPVVIGEARKKLCVEVHHDTSAGDPVRVELRFLGTLHRPHDTRAFGMALTSVSLIPAKKTGQTF